MAPDRGATTHGGSDAAKDTAWGRVRSRTWVMRPTAGATATTGEMR